MDTMMMDAMSGATASPSPVILSLWLIHGIGGALWIAGTVLIVFWAVKYLPAPQLRTLGLWVFVVGILISVLTVTAEAEGMRWILGYGHGDSTTGNVSMMEKMMQREDDSDAQLHQEHEQLLQSLRPSEENR